MIAMIRCLCVLGLVVGSGGCLDYGARSCQDLSCRAECVTDNDCAHGSVCVFTHDHCCSHCEVAPCRSDADCPTCRVCDTEQGECLATPCGQGCSDDNDCTADERCLPDDQGCCWRCEPYDPCAGLDCAATCASDPDCPPGAFCYFYEEGCCSMCVPADQEVLLVPTCVHAPWLVGAGGDFPLAVYGSPGCGWFDRVEVEVNGFDIQVRIIGRASTDPNCPPLVDCDNEDWTYMGLIWLPAPNPGAYTITVSGSFQLIVGASGGIVEDPVCQDDCGVLPLELGAWSLVHLSAQDLSAGCGLHHNDGRSVMFEGRCQDYTVVADDWPFPADAFQCRDDWVTFGPGPLFSADASLCRVDDPQVPPLMLGIGWVSEAGQEQAEAFLLEQQ